MSEMGGKLRIALTAFAARPRVLVAVDFDGTLAPLVTDPLQARAVPGGLEALRDAATLGGVTTAVVSGRDLETLETLRDELEAIRSRYPAVRLEHKPAAAVLHTRDVERSAAKAATEAAQEVGRRHTGVHVIPGKEVVELSVSAANKGNALADLARASSSEATLYVGDDATDERAFAALRPLSGDLTVKVGAGETVALHRVPDPEGVVELLMLFVAVRRLQG